MVAIPVFRSRVAPVLDWCTKVVVVDSGQSGPPVLKRLDFGPSDPFQRLREFHDKGVQTVICGTLSRELLWYAESLGLEVIYGISGEISEVIEGYRKGCLNEIGFRLPGCRGGQPYRRCRRRFGGEALSFLGRGTLCTGSGRATAMSSGACICPECGARVRHDPGIPCHRVACPECGEAMIRE